VIDHTQDESIRERVAATLADGCSVLVFAEGTTQRSGPPMKMYSGSLDIARQAGVKVLPVTLRYNMPVGLDKMDCPLSNALQVRWACVCP
jgi:1-acyl-sn-glycerol-3-phosphate acyltransferase